MTASFSIGMTISTGFATVVLPILFQSIIFRNDAQTGLTGTFHGSYGSHGVFGNLAVL
jgi:hypothetical protein